MTTTARFIISSQSARFVILGQSAAAAIIDSLVIFRSRLGGRLFLRHSLYSTAVVLFMNANLLPRLAISIIVKSLQLLH